jgi:RNA polymerase sigma-70 factor (ECF subfamily)
MEELLDLIEEHRHEFYRFALRNVWDSSVAEDVFSSAVLAVYEDRARFAPGTNFRAWMFRILANKCFTANRERARNDQDLDSASAELVSLEDARAYADVLAEPERFLEDCGDEVLRAFRRLSTAERSCFLLRAVERFTYKEIAEILEMPMGTVMTHLARGRAKLRRDLMEYAVQEGFLRQPKNGGEEDVVGEEDAPESGVAS